jgi:Family of unknown function (DUF5723)
MKKIKLFFPFMMLLVWNVPAYCQTEGSAFNLTGMGVSTPFARDYQTLGINPANLDIKGKYENKFTLGFSEIGLSLYSEVLSKPELRQNIFRQDVQEFSRDEQIAFAKEFANSDNTIDLKVTSLGFSMSTNKAGTFAFSIADKINFYSSFNAQIADIMWLGSTASYFDSLVVAIENGGYDTIPNANNIDDQTYQNVVAGITALQNAQSLSQLLEGSKFRFSWVREFNFGYGKTLWSNDNWEVNAGIGAKFLLGQALMLIDAKPGSTEAVSALSPIFDINYDEIADNNPSALDATAPPLKPVGKGFGVDLGASVVFKNKFILSASMTDIGSMSWDGNLYKLKDIQLTNFENTGLESVDFLEQIDQLNGSDALLEWQGETTVKTQLPTMARFGFGYEGKALRVGIDVIAPANTSAVNTDDAVIAIGGDYQVFKFLHAQIGMVTGGDYGMKIPMGIYFTVGSRGSYECGVSSRDMFTFFRDNQPTISLATGFMRFRF